MFQKIYGGDGGKLQFVVMLREPLSRMQSWFYYCGHSIGFQEHAGDELKRNAGSVWHSFYGWQMSEWTRIFLLRQFYVIPFHLFGGQASQQICDDISERLRFKIECAPVVMDALHGNHPALQEDTTEEFRHNFSAYMAHVQQQLVEVLTRGSARGMGLPGYKGTPSDEPAVQKWLIENW